MKLGETKSDKIVTQIVTKYGDFYHLDSHQFWQITQKFTILGETKSDEIVTQIVTKCGDLFITSILTISGRSPKKSPYWVKQKVTESSHELSQNSVIISSP